MLNPHDRIRPFIGNLVLDCGSNGFHELFSPGPATIPVPVEFRSQRHRPWPGDMPPDDQVSSHDKGSGITRLTCNAFSSYIERRRDSHVVAFPF